MPLSLKDYLEQHKSSKKFHLYEEYEKKKMKSDEDATKTTRQQNNMANTDNGNKYADMTVTAPDFSLIADMVENLGECHSNDMIENAYGANGTQLIKSKTNRSKHSNKPDKTTFSSYLNASKSVPEIPEEPTRNFYDDNFPALGTSKHSKIANEHSAAKKTEEDDPANRTKDDAANKTEEDSAKIEKNESKQKPKKKSKRKNIALSSILSGVCPESPNRRFIKYGVSKETLAAKKEYEDDKKRAHVKVSDWLENNKSSLSLPLEEVPWSGN